MDTSGSAAMSPVPAPVSTASAAGMDAGAREGCGTPQQCFEAALALEGTKADDRTAAANAYERACQGGICAACNNLGVLKMREDVPPDVRWGTSGPPAAGAALFEKACIGMCSSGCFNRARALLTGEGVAQDVVAALASLDKACSRGDLASCDYRGVVFESGSDLPRLSAAKLARDEKKAQDLYQKACDGGFGGGCSNLATLLQRRGNADAATVRRLYEKACAARLAGACSNLGIVLEQAGDATTARAKYDEACRAGSFDACKNAEYMASGSPSRRRSSQSVDWARDDR
jgi:TPR repeat protein